METFEKELKLVKLFQEQKSTPERCHKKPTGFSIMSVAASCCVLGALLRVTCKWVFFPNIDVYFY